MLTTEYIEIASTDGEGSFGAYLSRPANPNGKSVLLIQEIFGVNENIKITADWLASQGYIVCAPDLFWRLKPGVDLDSETDAGREEAMKLLGALDRVNAVADCLAAVEHLRSLSEKVGCVGFCLGGRLAYHVAVSGKVDCSVGYYGIGIETVIDQAENLHKPLLLHIPELDHMCPPDARQKIYEGLQGKVGTELYTYDGVGHAFARNNSQARNEEAAVTANERTLKFLAKNLSI